MSDMSSKAKRDFVSISKSVFPQNVRFDPMDYYHMFNVNRSTPLRAHTYLSYLGKVINSGVFPELTRSRSCRIVSFSYFLKKNKYSEPSEPSKPSEPSEPSKPSNPSKSRLSSEHLKRFIEIMQTLMIPGKQYTATSLRYKYNRHVWRFKVGKGIKTTTVKGYLRLAIKSDAWPGLSGEIGCGNAYRYKWAKPSQVKFREYQKESKRVYQEQLKELQALKAENQGIPEIPIESSDKVFKLKPLECKSCDGQSPGEAEWCMHCGSRLIKIVLQKCAVTVTGKPAMSKYAAKIEAFIKDYVVQNLAIHYSKEDRVYSLTIKGDN